MKKNVYAMESNSVDPETLDTWTKLGITSQKPNSRKLQLETGCPGGIKSVRAWQFENAEGIESHFHKLAKDAGIKIFKEWIPTKWYKENIEPQLELFGSETIDNLVSVPAKPAQKVWLRECNSGDIKSFDSMLKAEQFLYPHLLKGQNKAARISQIKNGIKKSNILKGFEVWFDEPKPHKMFGDFRFGN